MYHTAGWLPLFHAIDGSKYECQVVAKNGQRLEGVANMFTVKLQNVSPYM